MFNAIFGSFEAGIIYALMALGVYLSFRILDFPDMTVDGSFVTGAATASVLIVSGTDPFIATFIALVVGFIAGCITGLLHTKGKINALLAGILMQIALYSINLRIMGKPNVPLLQEETVITKLTTFWQSLKIDDAINSVFSAIGLGAFIPKTWGIFIVMIIIVYIVKKALDYFLRTDIGLAVRATGDNATMIAVFRLIRTF